MARAIRCISWTNLGVLSNFITRQLISNGKNKYIKLNLENPLIYIY